MKRELTYSGMGPMEVLPVELGGTGQSSDKDTIKDFNMLTIPELNALNGVLAYRQDGTIDPNYIPSEIYTLTPLHLEFQAEYPTSTAVVLPITDFDAWTNYAITATFNGQALTTTFDAEVGQISLTTPGTPGMITLVINGHTYYLNVVNQSAVRVVKPAITSPAAGSTNVNRTFQLLGTAMALSNNGVTSHDRSDWQIALDANFTQVVFQSINDATNKTSVEGVLTQPNTVYYARVRYHDAVYGLSPWSNTVTFTSKTTFAISNETAKLLGSDGTTGDYLGEAGFGYGPRGSFQTTAVNDTGSVIAASIRRIGSNGNSQGGLFIWRKQSGAWNEVKKILSSTSTQAQTMTLTIPTGASITVAIQGTTPSTTTYTTSQSITIPAGTTSVVLTGKGQDGAYYQDTLQPYIWTGPAITLEWTYIEANGYLGGTYGPPSSPPTAAGQIQTFREGYYNNTDSSVTVPLSKYTYTSIANMVQLNGQSATAVINGQTFTFSGGVGVPATSSTQTYTVANYGYFARDLALGTAVKSMGGEPLALNIPTGGSINVKTVGQTALNTTYTNSQTITVPTGTTEVILEGKGQDGSLSAGAITLTGSGSGSLVVPTGATKIGLDVKGGSGNVVNNTGQQSVIDIVGHNGSFIGPGGYGGAAVPQHYQVDVTPGSTIQYSYNIAPGGYGAILNNDFNFTLTNSGSGIIPSGVSQITVSGKRGTDVYDPGQPYIAYSGGYELTWQGFGNALIDGSVFLGFPITIGLHYPGIDGSSVGYFSLTFRDLNSTTFQKTVSVQTPMSPDPVVVTVTFINDYNDYDLTALPHRSKDTSGGISFSLLRVKQVTFNEPSNYDVEVWMTPPGGWDSTSFFTIPTRVVMTGNTSTPIYQDPDPVYGGSNHSFAYGRVSDYYFVNPGQLYIAPSTTPGEASRFTIGGTDYTFTSDVLTTQVVPLNVSTSSPYNVTIPSGGAINLSYQSSGSNEVTGLSSTATLNGQTYTFSGGVGIPASLATYSASAYENRMAVLDAQSMNNTQFSYDLIFYKDTGTDWTVAKRFTNIGIGKASDLTFKFSKDGNTFVLSDSTNNRLVVYTYTADWNTPTIINLGTFGITLPSTLGLGTQVAINATGTKIAFVLISSTGSRHFIVLSLSAGTWTKTMQYDFAANDYIEAVYANDDLSVLAGISNNGSYPVLNLYTSNGTTLTKVQAIEPPETDKVNSTFGASVDISSNGNTLAVSSLHYNQSSQVSTALIHIFERQTTLWQLARSLSATDEVLEDRFGVEIDLSADATTLVANGFSGAARNNRGAIYVFQ